MGLRWQARNSADHRHGGRVRAAREARARARVAAGESDALGQSFAAYLNQSLQDQDADAALMTKNVAIAQRATDDRLNTALSGIRSPSALEAGLQIATAGLSINAARSRAKTMTKGASGRRVAQTRPPR